MSRFTDAEFEIMKVLWDHGSLSPPEIESNFPRPIHNATLRSLLMILIEKDHVVREKRGKTFFYTAKTPKQTTRKSMVSRIIDVFYGGSPSDFIAQLIQEEPLSEEDIREIKKIANAKTQKQSKSNRKG